MYFLSLISLALNCLSLSPPLSRCLYRVFSLCLSHSLSVLLFSITLTLVSLFLTLFPTRSTVVGGAHSLQVLVPLANHVSLVFYVQVRPFLPSLLFVNKATSVP